MQIKYILGRVFNEELYMLAIQKLFFCIYCIVLKKVLSAMKKLALCTAYSIKEGWKSYVTTNE